MRSYDELLKIEPPWEGEVFISDSTIRDGSQMPGIVMSSENKIKIFEYLHRIGIEKIECFLYNRRDREVAKEMIDRNYDVPVVTAWARAVKRDIDLVLSMDGIDETGILMSVSDSHIFDKLRMSSREEAKKRYLEALDYALEHGLKVRCHLEDITRSDFDGFTLPFIKEILSRDDETIIRICDTLGFSLPFENSPMPYNLKRIIEAIKGAGAKNIETHIHDDFGFAAANSIAGYWYGANWSSVTFLGIGERAGNAELEKVLLFLRYRIKGFEKYDLSCLNEFANYIEENIKIRIPRNKAVVGKNIFAHESGIHTDGVLKNPFTYEPYPPELVGAKRKLMIGDSSGTEVIRAKIEEALRDILKMEVKVDKKDERVLKIAKEIHNLYDEGRVSPISDDEFFISSSDIGDTLPSS